MKIEAVALGVGYRSKKNFTGNSHGCSARRPRSFAGVRPRLRRSPVLSASIRFAGSVLGARGHICAFFRSREEGTRLLLPFIKEGFDRGERALHVVDPSRFEDHLRRLEAAGIAVAAARQSGQLTLCDWNDAYFSDGRFDHERMLALWKEVLEASEVSRFPRTRLIAHMEWSLEDRDGVADRLEYECRYNLIHDDRDTAICVYDINRHSSAALSDVLRVHPTIIVDGVLQDNLMYVRPEHYLEELHARPRGVPP